MKQTVYLVLENRATAQAPGPCFAVVKCRSTKPDLTKDQVAVMLNVEIPDNTFKTFIPEIKMTIPDEVMIRGGDVEVEVVEPDSEA